MRKRFRAHPAFAGHTLGCGDGLDWREGLARIPPFADYGLKIFFKNCPV